MNTERIRFGSSRWRRIAAAVVVAFYAMISAGPAAYLYVHTGFGWGSQLQSGAAVVGLSVVVALVFSTLVTLRTVLNQDGIAFQHLGHFWQLRRRTIPWQEIESIEVGDGPRLHPVLRLTDGSTVRATMPSNRRGSDFWAELDTIRQWHAAATGRATPEPLVGKPRVRDRWSRRTVLLTVIAVAAIACLFLPRSVKIAASSSDSSPAVPPSACDLVPATVLQRVVPVAQRTDVGTADNSVFCGWEQRRKPDTYTGELSLKVSVETFHSGAKREYERQLHKAEAEHVVHQARGVGDAGNSWVSFEASSYSAESPVERYSAMSHARVGGLIVAVDINTENASSPTDAEQQAVAVAQAVAARLRGQS